MSADFGITTEQESHQPERVEGQAIEQSNGSDYGDFDDDDLDDASLFEVLSAQPQVLAINHPHTAKSKRSQDPPRRQPSPEPQRPAVVDARKSPQKQAISKGDEFDDSDDDLFVGLEDMLATFDAKAPMKRVAHVTNGLSLMMSQTNTVLPSDSDDEFDGGGLDNSDFEVAERAATQSVQQTYNSLLPVRLRDP